MHLPKYYPSIFTRCRIDVSLQRYADRSSKNIKPHYLLTSLIQMTSPLCGAK